MVAWTGPICLWATLRTWTVGHLFQRPSSPQQSNFLSNTRTRTSTTVKPTRRGEEPSWNLNVRVTFGLNSFCFLFVHMQEESSSSGPHRRLFIVQVLKVSCKRKKKKNRTRCEMSSYLFSNNSPRTTTCCLTLKAVWLWSNSILIL